MAREGQAKVLSTGEFRHALQAVESHRYPEKNALILQCSFKLGLRAQEMALLRIREVAKLGPEYPGGYELKDLMILPKGFTKGARAQSRKTLKEPQRTSVRFTIAEFDRLVDRIASDAAAGKEIDPRNYYPELKASKGKSRELPLVDSSLIAALKRYLDLRIDQEGSALLPEAPLFKNQKGDHYSPNTLQDHIALMLRRWAGIERASSHSGRRTLATMMLQNGEHLKAVQQLLGHKDAATTVIYHQIPETEVREIFSRIASEYSAPSLQAPDESALNGLNL